MSALGAVFFYFCALVSLLGALAVVIAKNPIRGAMGLLLLILSIAGLFVSLSAQFLAVIQLIVYAGAIVILFLFVIMLLGPSASPPSDARGIVARALGGGLFGLLGLGLLWVVVRSAPSPRPIGFPSGEFGSIDAFGSVLFSDALAPFELSSALLMVAVVGAIAVARGRQGAKSPSKAIEALAARTPPPSMSILHGGVFSHESAGAAPLPGPSLAAHEPEGHST